MRPTGTEQIPNMIKTQNQGLFWKLCKGPKKQISRHGEKIFCDSNLFPSGRHCPESSPEGSLRSRPCTRKISPLTSNVVDPEGFIRNQIRIFKKSGFGYETLHVMTTTERPGARLSKAKFSCVDRFWPADLKVHKIEIFFGFDFEICIISLLVMSKY